MAKVTTSGKVKVDGDSKYWELPERTVTLLHEHGLLPPSGVIDIHDLIEGLLKRVYKLTPPTLDARERAARIFAQRKSGRQSQATEASDRTLAYYQERLGEDAIVEASSARLCALAEGRPDPGAKHESTELSDRLIAAANAMSVEPGEGDELSDRLVSMADGGEAGDRAKPGQVVL